jgi:hypothetical protein
MLSGMAGNRGRVLRSAARLVGDENLDLYILACAALTFTVLGFTGVSSVAVLTSAVLALLATLALSQIRSRRHVSAIAAGARADPLALFQQALPPELDSLRSASASYLFIGESMARLVHTGRDDIRRLMREGRAVRVLLLDPDDPALMRAADRTGERLLEGRIHGTLNELASLRDTGGGQLEIRICSFVPRISLNAFNLGEPNGVLFIQHYEHRPAGDSLPVFRLDSKDGFWYQHFAAEAVRMWEDAIPWPPAPGTRLARAPRPLFAQNFGPDLDASLSSARELLITGVTRNGFVNSHFSQLEELLSAGRKIRFLLTHPDSDAITVAADRYYAERSTNSASERTRQTLRLLNRLGKSAHGAISVRLSSHPLTTGVIAVDTTATTPASAIFAECYAYQARGGGPKFTLQPADGHWFTYYAAEAERLWDSGQQYPLTHPQ